MENDQRDKPVQNYVAIVWPMSNWFPPKKKKQTKIKMLKYTYVFIHESFYNQVFIYLFKLHFNGINKTIISGGPCRTDLWPNWTLTNGWEGKHLSGLCSPMGSNPAFSSGNLPPVSHPIFTPRASNKLPSNCNKLRDLHYFLNFSQDLHMFDLEHP